MSDDEQTPAIRAADAPLRGKPSNYPEPFASRMAGQEKRPLGDLFGLESFGANLTRLPPGAMSALHHVHSVQDEMIYVLEGRPTLFIGDEAVELEPGMCAGFRHGDKAHHLENRTDEDAVFLEIGDRQAGDAVSYPADDLEAARSEAGWTFVHKDGRPYG